MVTYYIPTGSNKEIRTVFLRMWNDGFGWAQQTKTSTFVKFSLRSCVCSSIFNYKWNYHTHTHTLTIFKAGEITTAIPQLQRICCNLIHAGCYDLISVFHCVFSVRLCVLKEDIVKRTMSVARTCRRIPELAIVMKNDSWQKKKKCWTTRDLLSVTQLN